MSSHSSLPKTEGFLRMWEVSAETGTVGHSDRQTSERGHFRCPLPGSPYLGAIFSLNFS